MWSYLVLDLYQWRGGRGGHGPPSDGFKKGAKMLAGRKKYKERHG